MSYIYYIRVGNTLAYHEYFSIHLFGENYIYPDPEKSEEIETLINNKYNMSQEERLNGISLDIKLKMVTQSELEMKLPDSKKKCMMDIQIAKIQC